jgi:hypothetical protein
MADEHRTELVVAGVVRGAGTLPVHLVIAVERVAPDDVPGELLALRAVELHTDELGRFAYHYPIIEEVGDALRGWVMCTVLVRAGGRSCPVRAKVVRWHRTSPSELVAGLNALLGTIAVDANVRA